MFLCTIVALSAIGGFVCLVATTNDHGTAEFGLFILAWAAIEAMSNTPLFKFNYKKESDGEASRRSV